MFVFLHIFSAVEGGVKWQGQQEGSQLDGVASNSGKDDRTANQVMILSLMLWRCLQQRRALCLNNFIESHSNPESKLLFHYFRFTDVKSELRKCKKITGPYRYQVAELGLNTGHPFVAPGYPSPAPTPPPAMRKRAASRRTCSMGSEVSWPLAVRGTGRVSQPFRKTYTLVWHVC